MTVSRQRLRISTDTGSFSDTGPAFTGGIVQVRWVPTTADTGGDLALTLLSKEGDAGWTFYNDADCLGAGFTRVPMQPVHGYSGTDTGSNGRNPIVGAGDRIRATVTPGGAAVVGDVYIWTYTG